MGIFITITFKNKKVKILSIFKDLMQNFLRYASELFKFKHFADFLTQKHLCLKIFAIIF